MTQAAQNQMEQTVRPLERSIERFVRVPIPNGESLREARELLRIGQREIAAKAGVALSTLSVVEAEEGGNLESLQLIRAALIEEGLGAESRHNRAMRILVGIRTLVK